jgi:hypothetical protein
MFNQSFQSSETETRTEIRPALAAAIAFKYQLIVFGAQIPIRSPGFSPIPINPAAIRSA